VSLESEFKLNNVVIKKSRYYHGRYECGFYGRRGREMKQWLRDAFGEDDDMIYASVDDIGDGIGYDAMINDEQLTLMIIKWT
jgi:hypothetical protein